MKEKEEKRMEEERRDVRLMLEAEMWGMIANDPLYDEIVEIPHMYFMQLTAFSDDWGYLELGARDNNLLYCRQKLSSLPIHVLGWLQKSGAEKTVYRFPFVLYSPVSNPPSIPCPQGTILACQ